MNNLRERSAGVGQGHVCSLYGVLQFIYQREPPPGGYDQPLDLVYRKFFEYLITATSLLSTSLQTPEFIKQFKGHHLGFRIGANPRRAAAGLRRSFWTAAAKL